MKELTGEDRIWLSALLLVVAEQDERFVKIKHRNGERDKRTRQRIAEEAREFVASDNFVTMCDVFGFNPEVLRSKTPQQAYEAYKRVVNDDLEIEDNKWL